MNRLNDGYHRHFGPWGRRVPVPGLPAVCAVAMLCLVAAPASALVHYDQGRRQVNGIQLLQDYSEPNVYYYVPQFPRMAQREDGSMEFLCVKYVDPTGQSSGGLFHALVEFTLPPEVVEQLEADLKQDVPNARIAGPVPMMQAVEDGQEGVGSFQVISAVLADREQGGFTRSLVTSGKAPLMPGSKAVVAAILSPQGATLLFDTFTGATSDVSVSISGYYEAAVKAYNAKVTAEVETVYTHFSRLSNVQREFSRRQVRRVVDDLQRDGTLKVEVMDRTQSLGIEAREMESILQLVTDKLTELMFDHETGWSADPPREVAVEANQIQGRQQRGWFSRVFGGAQDTPYFTDDQWVLKRREDVRRNTFQIVLDKVSTIRAPVYTAGNLGGLHEALAGDERYFRIVNLADPAFEFRTVHFQVDGEYVDSFKDTINFVSVNVRKTYRHRPAFTTSLHFSHADIQAGKTIQEVSFPRLGETGADWTHYEYQVRWSVRDRPTVTQPPAQGAWVATGDAAVSLTPPFEKRVLEVDAERTLFAQNSVATAVVEVATMLAGRPRLTRLGTLRAGDAEPTMTAAVYGDRGEPMAYRVSWHSPRRSVTGPLRLLESDYLYLSPPALNDAAPGPGEEGGGEAP